MRTRPIESLCKPIPKHLKEKSTLDNIAKPGSYFRYIDGTFVIVDSKPEWDQFYENLNLLHPALKCTVEKDQNNSLNFLAVSVEKEGIGFLTSVYRKLNFTILCIS